jgi:type VI secretion system protein ImpC
MDMNSRRGAINCPFHILILGDFSARVNRRVCETGAQLAKRRPWQVDRDNLEELLEKWDVQLTRTIVIGEEEPITVQFKELDDFHPDNLFENVALFSSLRTLRQRLLNPDTFGAAAEEVLGWGQSVPANDTTEQTSAESTQKLPADKSQGSEQNLADLLDGMLAEAQASDQDDSLDAEVDWSRFIQEIVAPAMPRRIDPRQDELVSCVDLATQSLMMALLHHPHFRQLEAAWRGLDFLVRRVETDVTLKIFLLDVSKQELVADLLGHQELADAGLYRLLVEQTVHTPGAVPWSLLGGLYTFGESTEEIELLRQLARVASEAKAPFLAAADGSLVGCHSIAKTPDPDHWEVMSAEIGQKWDAACHSSEASYAGLLWPRFLLRLPYGAATRPIDAFAFEEMPDRIRHEHLLWGNPVFLAAAAIAQSFTEFGWSMQMSQGRELTDLPVITEQENGETVLHPCGELLLSERASEHLRRRGVTPVLSIQGRDAVRLPTLQSLHGTALDEG